MAAETFFSEGNAAFVDDDFTTAIKKYSEAIELNSYNPEYYIKRAAAYIKVDQFEDAVKDSISAINLQKDNPKGYLRKGVAEFNLEKYKEAHTTFLEGQKFDKDSREFKTWIRKCKAELNLEEEEEKETPEQNGSQSRKDAEHPVGQSSKESDNTSEQKSVDQQPPPTQPVVPKARYDWYQTATHVVINMMVKNTKKEDVHVNITENTFSACVKLSSGSEYTLDFVLAHHVNVPECRVKIMSTKIEVKLKKIEGIHWSDLERDDSDLKITPRPKGDDKQQDNASHPYPSSSHVTRNWDKLAKDIEKEDADEDVQGDAALNKLFQQIYGDGSDEVKRAMNKSFVESGGTVLSTNWEEIGKQKVDVKPPDGMEYKKWDT